MTVMLVHVAVDRRDLESVYTCDVLPLLLPLLAQLGIATSHPNLLEPCAIDSVGFYLDESNAEARRAELVSGTATMEFKTRKFDIMPVQAADALESAQRRQCVAIQGTNEVARRLDAGERGAAEILISFRGGATLSVRQNKRPERMVVLCTSALNKKKVLEANLDADELVALFAAASSSSIRTNDTKKKKNRTKHMTFTNEATKGEYWVLPAWYAEAWAVVAQDVFRLHVMVSATSQHTSRAIFVDRVTSHRGEKTLLKTVLHGASGGCACGLHREKQPTQPFKHLVMRVEFCGHKLKDGKCQRHFLAERTTESAAFPGVCMVGFCMQFHCEHEDRAGIRIPLQTDDARMNLGFAHRFLVDLAACGARLMVEREHVELEKDVSQLLQELENQRIAHNHKDLLQNDIAAVHLLRKRASAVSKILKTHKHLFRPQKLQKLQSSSSSFL